jgi:hypothetical protein
MLDGPFDELKLLHMVASLKVAVEEPVGVPELFPQPVSKAKVNNNAITKALIIE